VRADPDASCQRNEEARGNVSCYEAGYDGFWLHRLLEAHGIRNYVIDPASLQVDRRARRAKTDRVDVERLLRSLMAYRRGEPKVWSVVRVPSVAEEDDRRLHRERGRLINERIQHVNRIKGLLAIHGIHDYQPLRRDRMRRLERLHTAGGRTLPGRPGTPVFIEEYEQLLAQYAPAAKPARGKAPRRHSQLDHSQVQNRVR
jgi:transposase